MTRDRQDEDEFEKLLRESIDGKSKGGEGEGTPWEGQEDVYTPSDRRPADTMAPNPKRAAERSDDDQAWDRNIGSAVYAIRGQQVSEEDAAAADPTPTEALEDETGPDRDGPLPSAAKQLPDRPETPVPPGNAATWGLRIVFVVAAIALAGWLTLRDQQGFSRLTVVEQGLADLRQHLTADEQDAAYLVQLESRLMDLETAIAELSSEVPSQQPADPADPATNAQAIQQRLSDQTEQLNGVSDRIEALEKEIVALQKTGAEPGKAPSTSGSARPKTGDAAGGGWVINLISVSSPDYATRLLARYRELGVEAERVEIKRGGKTFYRLRISGFPSRAQAEGYATEVRSKLGLKETWITRS